MSETLYQHIIVNYKRSRLDSEERALCDKVTQELTKVLGDDLPKMSYDEIMTRLGKVATKTTNTVNPFMRNTTSSAAYLKDRTKYMFNTYTLTRGQRMGVYW